MFYHVAFLSTSVATDPLFYNMLLPRISYDIINIYLFFLFCGVKKMVLLAGNSNLEMAARKLGEEYVYPFDNKQAKLNK